MFPGRTTKDILFEIVNQNSQKAQTTGGLESTVLMEFFREADIACCEKLAVDLHWEIMEERRLEWTLIADVVDRICLIFLCLFGVFCFIFTQSKLN